MAKSDLYLWPSLMCSTMSTTIWIHVCECSLRYFKGERTSAMSDPSDPAFCLCINLTPATSFLKLGTHTAQRAHCPLTLEIQPLCEISRSCAPVGVVRDKNTYSFQHHIISGPQILFPCLLMGPPWKWAAAQMIPYKPSCNIYIYMVPYYIYIYTVCMCARNPLPITSQKVSTVNWSLLIWYFQTPTSWVKLLSCSLQVHFQVLYFV